MNASKHVLQPILHTRIFTRVYQYPDNTTLIYSLQVELQRHGYVRLCTRSPTEEWSEDLWMDCLRSGALEDIWECLVLAVAGPKHAALLLRETVLSITAWTEEILLIAEYKNTLSYLPTHKIMYLYVALM